MDDLLRLSVHERRAACESARIALGLPAQAIEKDLWVSWVLRELFQLRDWGDRLTFKGGTSLSKCWKLIDRFSEDVDVVIDRDYLGFGGDRLSAKQLKRLRQTCAHRIREELLPELSRRMTEQLGEVGPVQLDIAGPEEDPDLQTLHFRYPTAFPTGHGYLRPVVRIELGARSDTEPSERAVVAPLLAEDRTFSVRAVSPR